MLTLLSLTTLWVMIVMGIMECRRPGACLAPGVLRHAFGGRGARLLSVNWNGDEGGKKSGGK